MAGDPTEPREDAAEQESLAAKQMADAMFADIARKCFHRIFEAAPVEQDHPGDVELLLVRIISTRDELANALGLVMPMVKGYALAHPIGGNYEVLDYAEAVLKRATLGEGEVPLSP